MLPVCSATSCSYHSQISSNGGFRPFSTFWKTFEDNSHKVGRAVLDFSNGTQLGRVSFKRKSTLCCYSKFAETIERNGSIDFVYRSLYPVAVVDELQQAEPSNLKLVESLDFPDGADQIRGFTTEKIDITDGVPNYTESELVTTLDPVPNDLSSVSGSSNMDVNSLSSSKKNVADVFAGVNESIADTIKRGESSLNNSLDDITSSVTTALRNANEAVDNAFEKIISSINSSGNSAGEKLTGLSSNLKEASGKVGLTTLDLLRKTIIVVEDSLSQGATYVGYAYGSAKELLPAEVRDALSLSEESVIRVWKPVGTALQQVYVAFEGFEESVGLDPNDPLISFLLLSGVSATLWASYRVLKYSGYAGDLSPELALELLQGKENTVLIDVRPEDLRERDGIPDLRRTARFRYTSVSLPEVDGSVKKLLKNGREVEDMLLAAVIRNLKIVQGRSMVFVMDADGTRSKAIARSLRKLGTKRPYLVQGGFRSWVKDGLRIKELKPETPFTILNEEAEAILEDIKPTPLKVIGYGVGFLAAAYALLEWEKTLQLIGVIGLGQTIYRRVITYEDSEDFKQDVRLLLAPVRFGGQAVSWAAGKLETTRNGLPTSPSSSDVQSRVLQAAAKHESQPPDGEEMQDSSLRVASDNENVDLSEA